jgi:hypothetical protein
MTRRKAAAIGSRLALGRGVSQGLALLRAKLTMLDVPLGSDATMPATLTRLGKRFSMLAATIAPISRSAPRIAASIGLPSSGSVDLNPQHFPAIPSVPPHIARATANTALFAPIMHYPAAISSPLLPTASSPIRFGFGSPAAPYNAPPEPDTKDPEDAPHVARPAAHRASHAIATPAWQGDSQSPLQAMSRPAYMPSLAPVIANIASNTTSGPEPNVVTPQTAEQSSSPSVALVQSSQWPDRLRRVAPSQRSIVAAAPENFTAAPIVLPKPQDDWAANGNSASTWPPPDPKRNFSRQVVRATPRPTGQPESTQDTREQPQGTIAIDGAQMGRWMIDHLERQASRPGTMTTGFDPRMTATFPGAPIGA